MDGNLFWLHSGADVLYLHISVLYRHWSRDVHSLVEKPVVFTVQTAVAFKQPVVSGYLSKHTAFVIVCVCVYFYWIFIHLRWVFVFTLLSVKCKCISSLGSHLGWEHLIQVSRYLFMTCDAITAAGTSGSDCQSGSKMYLLAFLLFIRLKSALNTQS